MSKNTNKKYHVLRARVIASGTTLAEWARTSGFPMTTVYQAASGMRAGVKAVAIRRRLEKEFAS